MTGVRALGFLATAALCVGAVTTADAAGRRAFPNLTTIYVIPGVVNTGGDNAGVATSVHCTNTSGASVSVRVVALRANGTVAGDQTRTLAHGATATFSTHETTTYLNEAILNTLDLFPGVINVEATHPSVFCSANSFEAAGVAPIGVRLHMVRVNGAAGVLE